MRSAFRPIVVLALLGAQAAPDRPERAGLLRIATSPALAPLVAREGGAFAKRHPGTTIRLDARGSDVAMALLYTGQADVAVIGRQATDPEVKAYQWVYRRPPVERAVFAGSEAAPGHSSSIAVIVNAASPRGSISLDELRDAYLNPGSPTRFARLYLPDTESGTGRFLRHALFADATLFAWHRVHESATSSAVRLDRAALSLADGPVPAGTRAIALRDGGRLLQRGDSDYPLTRTVFAYGADGDDAASRFMEFVRCAEGQALIAGSPYRPLTQTPDEVAK